MSAPRWMSAAMDDELFELDERERSDFAKSLIERLPIEVMVDAIAVLPSTRDACIGLVSKIVHVLADGDPEVACLADLYQGAVKALDDAGVPYAVATSDSEGNDCNRELDLAGRIRWLARRAVRS